MMDTSRSFPLTSEIRTQDALSGSNPSLTAKIVDMDWSGEELIKLYLLVNNGKVVLFCIG